MLKFTAHESTPHNWKGPGFCRQGAAQARWCSLHLVKLCQCLCITLQEVSLEWNTWNLELYTGETVPLHKEQVDMPARPSCLTGPLTHMSHQGPTGTNQTLVWQHLPTLSFPTHKLSRGNHAWRVVNTFFMNQVTRSSQQKARTRCTQLRTTQALCLPASLSLCYKPVHTSPTSPSRRLAGQLDNKVPGKMADVNSP